MNYLSDIICIYAYITVFSASLSILFRRKVSKMIPISLMISVIITYSVGIFTNDLRLGFVSTGVIPIVAAYFTIKKYWKNFKGFLLEMASYFDVAFFVFTFMFFFMAYFHSETHIITYDEIRFWSPIVREMYETNQYYYNLSSNFINSASYPPFVQTLEVIFCFLCRNFEERILYLAVSVFSVSMFVGFVNINTNDYKKAILFSFTFILIIIFSNLTNFVIEHSSYDYFTSFFETIQPDQLQGLIISFCICYILTEDFNKFGDIIILSLSLTSLVITKQIGPAFYAMCLFFYVLKKIAIKSRFSKRDLLLLIIPIFLYLLWRNQIPLSNFTNENQVISGAAQAVKDSDFYKQAISNYLFALNHSPMIEAFGLKLMYIPFNLFLTITILLLLVRFKIDKKIIICLGITIVIGLFGYAITQEILYLTVFTETEALITASFERYLSMYVYVLVSIICMVTMFYAEEIKSSKIIIFVLLMMLFLSGGKKLELLNKEDRYNYKNDKKITRICMQLDKYANPNTDVLIISQERFPFDEAYIVYCYNDINFEFTSVNYNEYDSDHYKDIEISEWIQYYKQFDLVYTYFTDQKFWDYYWKDLQSEFLLNDRMYTIEENGELKLLPWEE